MTSRAIDEIGEDDDRCQRGGARGGDRFRSGQRGSRRTPRVDQSCYYDSVASPPCAGVVKLADARDSKSRVPKGREGSTPSSGTISYY